jgi:hypothetical protein
MKQLFIKYHPDIEHGVKAYSHIPIPQKVIILYSRKAALRTQKRMFIQCKEWHTHCFRERGSSQINYRLHE